MGKKYVYICLLDEKHKNMIVRALDEEWEIYRNGEWIQTGILIEYFCDESPYYEMYEEISETEAMKIINNN